MTQGPDDAALYASRLMLRRLRVALIASLIVPVLMFVGFAWYDHDQVLSTAADDARTAAAMLREHTLKVLQTNQLVLDDLVWRIRDRSWEQIKARRQPLNAEIAAIMARNPEIGAISLADENGILQVLGVKGEETAPEPGFSVARREYWLAQKQADHDLHVTHSYKGAYTGEWVFSLSRRLSLPGGGFGGSVQTAIEISYFTSFWQHALRPWPHAAVALVRTDGEILARYPAPARPDHMYVSPNGPLMRFLRDGSARHIYYFVSPLDHVERLAAMARIDGYPLAVGIELSVPAVLSAWYTNLICVGLICLIAAAALAFIVQLGMRQALALHDEQERRLEAERTVLEAQRLEVLGQLTAGVAHDFGNIIQAVEGSAAIIQKVATDERVLRTAGRIAAAATRGGVMVRRMMDFARRETDDTKSMTLDPARVVEGAADLLSHTLGSRYNVEARIESEVLPMLTRGDSGGLENAIMNLAINARDAMPGGGSIVIDVAAAVVGAASGMASGAGVSSGAPSGLASGPQAGPHLGMDGHGDPVPASLAQGRYARISVTDSGTGMAPETLARAGEAFFTTKPRGRGTGLGLAGARGFAMTHGGGFQIISAVGKGTSVILWLPEAERADSRPATADQTAEMVHC